MFPSASFDKSFVRTADSVTKENVGDNSFFKGVLIRDSSNSFALLNKSSVANSFSEINTQISKSRKNCNYKSKLTCNNRRS
jgi:hypothetical protein